MKIILIAFVVFFASSLCSTAAPEIEDIAEVEIEYWKWTAGRTVSYWDLVFTATEIKPLQEVLRRAKPVEKSEVAWFITSLEGTFTTREGKYKFKMGDEKIPRQTYRLSITPEAEGSEAKTEHFHLSKSDGREFQSILDVLITPKIGREPDRIVEH